MIVSNAVILLPLAVIPLLWSAVASDLADRRIPNWISLGIVLLFLLYCSLNGATVSLAPHLYWALATFAGLFLVFALGRIGGGDVKLSTAVMLWVGPDRGLRFLYITAIGGGVLAFLLVLPLTRRLLSWNMGPAGPGKDQEDVSVPYGLAISVAGTICLYEQFLDLEHP